MLSKPQIPTPQQIQGPRDWGSLAANFTQITSYLQNNVRYLQQYLGTVHNSIVPFQLPPTGVGNGQSPYTVLGTDVFIAASSGSTSNTTINLPVATGSGRTIIIKKIDANAHNVVVMASGSDTIDGSASFSITLQYQSISVNDAAAGSWFIF